MDNLSVSLYTPKVLPNKTESLNKTFSAFALPHKADSVQLSNTEIKPIAQDKPEHKKGLNLAVLAFTIIGTAIPLAIVKHNQFKALTPELVKQGKEELRELLNKSNIFKNAKVSTFIKNNSDKLSEFNQKWNILNVDLENIKIMLSVAGGSILGGLTGGLITEKNKDSRKNIIKESIFQFINVATPASAVFLLEKATSSFKAKEGSFVAIALKAFSLLGGVLGGLPLGAAISNGINRILFDKTGASDRKISPKDYLVHVDDLISSLAFMNIPGTENIIKLLPALYAMCGYNAGNGGEHHE